MPAITLPNDIVAIDSGNRSYLFYVNSNNVLSYLESPDEYGNGDYVVKKVQIGEDDVHVSGKSKQVAAVTWNAFNTSTREIRVYFVAAGTEYLSEVVKSGNNPWESGLLGSSKSVKRKIAEGSSISATVHAYETGWNLRVFGAGHDQTNDLGVPQISVFKFTRDESNKKPTWTDDYITNEIKKY